MKNYICMPDPEGTFNSLLDCEGSINDTSVLAYQPVESSDIRDIANVSKHDDRKIAIPSRLQAHINHQNGLHRRSTWEKAKSEISDGHKTSCWMWYVFPAFFPVRQTRQLSELALKDLKEVRDYIAVDILRTHLIEITQIAQKRLSEGISAEWLFGDDNDASKFWECITLFFLVSINWTLPYPSKQEVDMLNKVCGEVLQVLKPDDFTDPHTYFNGGYMLHAKTVNKVIRQDSTISKSLTKDTYYQKYIKYKYKYLQYKKTLQ
jgi:uncharacterized protein (DUF1810 family)